MKKTVWICLLSAIALGIFAFVFLKIRKPEVRPEPNVKISDYVEGMETPPPATPHQP